MFKPEYRDIGFHIRNVLKRDSLKRALNKKNSDKLFINPNYLYDSINVDVIPGSLIIVEGITPEYISSPITIGIGGVEMKDGPFIPGGTSLKILEVRTTNSTKHIIHYILFFLHFGILISTS